MTHPDDITAYLKAKLEDRNPKCANCKWWQKPEPFRIETFGLCVKYAAEANYTRDVQSTTDLSLCSAWERREKTEE